jgi:photolyase PhrII
MQDIPQQHRARVRALNQAAQRASFNTEGNFVLLWLHHAVRAHENPALDVALAIAKAAQRPLLVYQGLAGRHRFNADRHHQFILQGAQQLAAELAALGIPYIMHLPSDPAAPSPLRVLMPRAAAVICEDFPVPPFPRWTHALTHALSVPAIAVDACSILPMQTHQRVFDRAFAFRDKSAQLWPAQIQQTWSTPRYDGGALASAHLQDAGLRAMPSDSGALHAALAECAIDHSLAPIAHTLGGSAAGYARWERFRKSALSKYAALRNDAALVHAVSRLSAYLHHGHISPFRIARDAQAIGGAGAEKFLDELLVWRDLAHHWCFHQSCVEVLTALPNWAQASLAEHAPQRFTEAQLLERGLDAEALEQARSPDALWNLAQLSLLRQGELHNNLRMTWGKVLAQWASSPRAALSQLIAFNHRFALDGNNPNSYGGLLWCLGLFDRPFSGQAASSLGTIRARPSAVHANRLDLQRYGAFVQATQGPKRRIAIIGAGIAGLACARALVDAGHDITLFEKSRGVGGRLSTRRTDFAQYDHGAQYFTARDPRFLRWVKRWRQQGLVLPWRAPILAIDAGSLRKNTVSPERRFIAQPGMNALAKHLADTLRDQLQLMVNTQIDALSRHDQRWQLSAAGQGFEGFDDVLLAIPAPQAAALLKTVPAAQALRHLAESAVMQPCWASMLALHAPLSSPDFAGAFVNAGADQTSALRWIARDDSKAARVLRKPVCEAWVLHASAEFSARHIEAEADAVGAILLAEFARLIGEKPQVFAQSTHRWRYALGGIAQASDQALRERDSARYEPALGLGLAGDWLLGGRVESAFLSGQALAGYVLRHCAQSAPKLVLAAP